MKKIFLLLSCLLSLFSFAQVAISTDGSSPSANAMLDVKSTNKGVQFPRITTAQRKAINTTASDAGLMVFDTDKSCLYGFDGTEWQPFAYASTAPGAVVKKLPFSPTASWNGQLASEVSIDGIYAAVAAPEDSAMGVGASGSVYIHQKNSGEWPVMARLVAPVPQMNAHFGYAVAISGDYIAVGSYGEDINGKSNQGAVYLYMRNGATWGLQQKLTVPVAMADALFGISVSLDGDNLLVGASGATINGKTYQGAAFVFTRSGAVWPQTAQIIADDGAASDYFGRSVAMEDDYLVIGATAVKVNNINAGAAYVYVKGGGTWTKQQRLVSESPVGNSNFGTSVAIRNNYVVVGADADKYYSNECGKAYLFKRNGNQWSYFYNILPRRVEGLAGQHFGQRVKMAGEYLMISAWMEDVEDATQTGAVYLYRFDGTYYREVRRLSIPNATGGEYFGRGLGLDGASFIIGAPSMRRTIPGPANGVAFFGSLE